MRFDCAVIGGGIVGLATAMMVARREPGVKLVVLEKEHDLALHQSGRNSGVIHSGIYYKPGSLKARYAREGNRAMVNFCRRYGIRHEVCGKVIVATEESELVLLESLYRRGLENGLEVEMLSREQISEVEPYVRCLAGIKVGSTGIVDFRAVCRKFGELIRAYGGEIRTGAEVKQIVETERGHVVETASGKIEADFLINCSGLYSDRVARMGGFDPGVRIVPFRGEYYELVPERRDIVKSMIYPVPNAAFPFLGVHFTRAIDGSVHAGPNAVLALNREGYHKTDICFRDALETLTYSGFWRLAAKHFNEGMKEMHRSFRKAAFVRSLQRLIPEMSSEDLVPGVGGVRAQALLPNGSLVDDFLIVEGRRSLHVCNAPSPAATASLKIGEAVCEKTPRLSFRETVALNAG